MAQLTASRTLVKSTPELWAECSDAGSLARHLGAFGEIHITGLEPETAVAWEGDDARGTVTLEPSGWGTRVVLTASPTRASPPDAVASVVSDAVVAFEPAVEPEPESAGPGILRRLFGGWGRRSASGMVPEAAAATAPEPDAATVPPPEPGSPAAGPLADALDSLGRAHHRPFSRG